MWWQVHANLQHTQFIGLQVMLALRPWASLTPFNSVWFSWHLWRFLVLYNLVLRQRLALRGGLSARLSPAPCINTLGGRPRLGTHLAYNAKGEAGKADLPGPAYAHRPSSF